MLPLLAPVLAQIITLGVSDRTEARYVHAEEERFEGATSPGVDLNLDWHRFQLSLGYGPSLQITPLEEAPREILVNHHASLGSSYRFKHTTVSLGSTLSFGDVNFQLQALQTNTPLEPNQAGEAPGGDATGEPAQPLPNQPGQPNQPNQPNQPVAGSPLQPKVEDRVVRYAAWTVGAGVSHELSRDVQGDVFVGYSMAGAIDEADREQYPLTRGTVLGGSVSHSLRLSAQDGIVSTLRVLQAFSNTDGNRALNATASEHWGHNFNKHTSSYVALGLSMTRFSQDNGLVAISVFPDLGAGLSYSRPLARGTLSLSLGAFSAPVLDPLRATVDPRIGASGSIGWSRDRFSNGLSGTTAFSTAPKELESSAFDSYAASYTAQYRVGKWVSLDAGARYAMQQHQDVTTVPSSYSAFVGVSFGYAIPLVGNVRQ